MMTITLAYLLYLSSGSQSFHSHKGGVAAPGMLKGVHTTCAYLTTEGGGANKKK